MIQCKEGKMCALCQLTFRSDELVCHPQEAKDCGWSIHAADKHYQVIYSPHGVHQIECYNEMDVVTWCSYLLVQ